jgi:hypothetical protein
MNLVKAYFLTDNKNKGISSKVIINDKMGWLLGPIAITKKLPAHSEYKL